MAWTIYSAFSTFCTTVVDLSEEQDAAADLSSFSIISRLEELAENEPEFPRLKGEALRFGSFARKTKCRPLDDIDLLIVLDGSQAEAEAIEHDRYGYELHATAGPLLPFADALNDRVSSFKILDSVRDHLKDLRDLKADSVNRRLQAVRLQLDFRDWNFDLVPAVPIYRGGVLDGYLIPNGNGDWWKTDPRLDHQQLDKAVGRHGELILGLIRMVKYWNASTSPRLGSYHLETLVMGAMAAEGYLLTSDLPELLETCFERLRKAVFKPCPDPKGMGPDLDLGVDWLRRTQFSKNARTAEIDAWAANNAAREGETEMAFVWWQRLFGDTFSGYGS